MHSAVTGEAVSVDTMASVQFIAVPAIHSHTLKNAIILAHLFTLSTRSQCTAVLWGVLVSSVQHTFKTHSTER